MISFASVLSNFIANEINKIFCFINKKLILLHCREVVSTIPNDILFVLDNFQRECYVMYQIIVFFYFRESSKNDI